MSKTFHTSEDNSLDPQAKDKKINHFLQTVPFLSFSDKGLENIAKRFGISVESLKLRIEEFEQGGGVNV
ncbi:hypothetical protein [Rufibacter sp. XAAS-G3-1]|uniref:hypothetical protein n=1 Tax=Rufibacter sp. XAAS-G3-1 TaxID=2729134 RepID=UPI0015E6B492|nr:hypothetical protein [Rufibacter sp. XAAS-G3-1]